MCSRSKRAQQRSSLAPYRRLPDGAERQAPRARNVQRTIRPAPTLAPRVAARPEATPVVYPTTPISSPGSGIEVEKVPASVNIVDVNQIDRVRSANIADALQRYVPSIDVNEVTGNPFQPNVQFRGFVASPVAGTPRRLAGYHNGVRINEAFRDI